MDERKMNAILAARKLLKADVPAAISRRKHQDYIEYLYDLVSEEENASTESKNEKADASDQKGPPPKGYESWDEFNNAHPRGAGGKFGSGNSNNQGESDVFSIKGKIPGETSQTSFAYQQARIGGVDLKFRTIADSNKKTGVMDVDISPNDYDRIATSLREKYPNLKEHSEVLTHNLTGKKFTSKYLVGLDKKGNRITLFQHMGNISKGLLTVQSAQSIKDVAKKKKDDF